MYYVDKIFYINFDKICYSYQLIPVLFSNQTILLDLKFQENCLDYYKRTSPIFIKLILRRIFPYLKILESLTGVLCSIGCFPSQLGAVSIT